MTPEPTQTASAVSAQTIQVPAPVAGSTTTVSMVPGSELAFAFNPGEATMSRSDNDLVFESEGGSVVISDFFVVGEGGSLPMLRLPEGDLVSSEVVFADSGIDLSTAAGPAAGAPASGGTNYDDAAGGLLGGVDRLGALTTDGWSTAAAVADGDVTPALPAAGFDVFTFAFVSSPLANIEVGADGWVSGRFVNVLFEGGRPNKHLAESKGHPGYNETFFAQYGKELPQDLYGKTPGILEFTITPTGPTVLTGVTLSGFAVGSVLMVGDTFTTITDAGQVITLTPAQLTLTIGLFPPAGYSDADMSITATATGAVPGNPVTATADMLVTLVVDAVADLPEQEGSEPVVVEQFFTETDDDGVLAAKDEKPDKYSSTETQTVSLPYEVTFHDLDGSETHQIVISGVPLDWTLDENNLPEGILSGNIVDAADDSGERSITITVPAGVAVVSGDFVFTPHDWTNERAQSGEAHGSGEEGDSLYANGALSTIRGTAEETTFAGGEVTTANNYAETEISYRVSIEEDKPVFVDRGGDDKKIALLSDETPGVQADDDRSEMALDALPDAVKDILVNLGLKVDDVLSAAQSAIAYNLHSDGDKDGRDDPAEYSAVPGSKLFVRLQTTSEEGEEVPVTDSGWTTTDMTTGPAKLP